MKRIFFHTDEGRDAYVDISDFQYMKLKKERDLNMNHCDLAMDSLEEFIGCVMGKYAVVLPKSSTGLTDRREA